MLRGRARLRRPNRRCRPRRTSRARPVRRSTWSRANSRRPARRSSASRLVSTVTATTLVSGGAAAFAAAIIALPPAAWTVRIAGSRGASAATAFSTVFGMSWSLRSRKIGSPVLGDAEHALVPVRAEEFEAELHAGGNAADVARDRRRAVHVLRVEGDEDRAHIGRLLVLDGGGAARQPSRGCARARRSAGDASTRASASAARSEGSREGRRSAAGAESSCRPGCRPTG